jgi:hypothetical protein
VGGREIQNPKSKIRNGQVCGSCTLHLASGRVGIQNSKLRQGRRPALLLLHSPAVEG